jgi:hypothetical protein
MYCRPLLTSLILRFTRLRFELNNGKFKATTRKLNYSFVLKLQIAN